MFLLKKVVKRQPFLFNFVKAILDIGDFRTL